MQALLGVSGLQALLGVQTVPTMPDVPLTLVTSVVVIGLIHGAEPGHGWPVAATYALDKQSRWLAGLVAGLVIGVGHLVSSIAVVAAFLLLASVFDVTQYEWLARYVAGVLLIALGLRELTGGGHHHGHDGHGDHDGQDHADENPSEYLTSVTAGPSAPPGHEHPHGDGHSHDDGHSHGDGHSHDHGHSHDAESDGGWVHRLRLALPFVGHSHDDHDHAHGDGGHSHFDADGSESLGGLAVAAFALGFAHEEEFQILGFCTGATQYCLPLMLIYAFAVIVALVALTLLLVAGFEHFEEDVEEYADYFPYLSGGVLVLMGLGFLLGVL